MSCLEPLSNFQVSEGSLWCLREDAKRHPKLGPQLHNKLVQLANQFISPNLTGAAVKVLKNYGLDINGNPLPEVVNGNGDAAIGALTAESPV